MISLLKNSFSRRYEPFSLVHFITERCNARCQHCFIDFAAPADPALELSLTEIEQFTMHLGKTLYNVNITGGEPFLRDDLFDIVRCYLNHSTVKSIVITTNGWFTDRIHDFIRRYASLNSPCNLTIAISLDDFEQQHDQGRNLPGLYARALTSYRSVSQCNDRRVKADVTLTVTAGNAARITAIYHDLKQKGVASIFPVLVRAEGIAGESVDKDAITASYRKLCELTEAGSSKLDSGVVEALHKAKNRLAHDILSDTCRTPRYLTPCRAGSLFASIAADGAVAPCELLADKLTLGNLRDFGMDFLDLWNSANAQHARDQIKRTKCHCTFECAWTVNILTTPKYWPQMMRNTLKELL